VSRVESSFPSLFAFAHSNTINTPRTPRENRILVPSVKVPADASPRRRVRELRHEHADYIAQKKAEAHEAILLLERPTAQRAAAEREKDGLIIISAHYGRATNFSERGIRLGGGGAPGVNENGTNSVQPSYSAEHGEEYQHPEEEEVVVDVTVPVQALVQDSRLYIPGGRAKVRRGEAKRDAMIRSSLSTLTTPLPSFPPHFCYLRHSSIADTALAPVQHTRILGESRSSIGTSFAPLSQSRGVSSGLEPSRGSDDHADAHRSRTRA
jgi:hypothetical protein